MKRPSWSVSSTLSRLPRPGRPSRPGVLLGVLVGVLLGALLASGMALPAWAKVLPGPPDVLVKALGLNLAFGSEPEPELPPPPAPAPMASPAPAPRQVPTFEPFVPPPLEPDDLGVVTCDLTDVTFPDRPLQPEVEGVQVDGSYPWRMNGSVSFLGIEAELEDHQTTRIISDVQELGDGAFAYTYRSSFFFYLEVQRLEVRPQDGLYLVELRRENQQGPFFTFEPLAPVKIVSLPIPIDTMLPRNSTVEARLSDTLDEETHRDYEDAQRTERNGGVDPDNGRIVTYETAVRGAERVNACGEMVDGYLVTGRRTLTSPNSDPADEGDDGGDGDPSVDPPDPSLAGLIQLFGSTRLGRASVEEFELVIAPHLGGLIVRERLDHVVPFLEPSTGLPIEVHADFTISRLRPQQRGPSEDDE